MGRRGEEQANGSCPDGTPLAHASRARALKTSAKMHHGRCCQPPQAHPPPGWPQKHRHRHPALLRGDALNGPTRDTAPPNAPRWVRQSPNASDPRQAKAAPPRMPGDSKTQADIDPFLCSTNGYSSMNGRVQRPKDRLICCCREDCIQHRDSRLPSRTCLVVS